MLKNSANQRTGGARLRVIAGLLAMAVTTGFVLPAAAQQSTIIVGDDRGGYLGERANLITRIRALGQRVEIRGNICFSACTMYLGAGDVCISPATVFGFHGPSRNGVPLPPDSFDRWSEVMARHYNPSLRDWFMREARHQTVSVTRISGSELIRLGYQSC